MNGNWLVERGRPWGRRHVPSPVLHCRSSSSTLRPCLQELAQGCRPRSVANGDPQAPQGRAALGRALHHLPASVVRLAEVQCHLDRRRLVQATWILSSQRQRTMRPGPNQLRSLFGTADLGTEPGCGQVARPQWWLLSEPRRCPHESQVERIKGAMKPHLAKSPPSIGSTGSLGR
jgi:hypothetical protein